ncbi:MAG: ABC transporter ATP-binding protein [Candidatus Margulisiibacteriota bacterium]|nr:ABC transporter ATP-binding protein [Candidatus Margulisiibacteriota bacterium]
MSKIVKVDDLKKTYLLGEVKVPALQGVTFDVDQGEFVSITGHSGCGKSTLLHLIGCLDHPNSGKVFLDDINVSQLDDSQLAEIRSKKIGFVFQTFNLLPRLSAIENVELPLIYGNFSARKMRDKAAQVLSKMGLEHRADHRPPEMSGGERQRVAIARALVIGPSIILADEPTGNLDTKTSEEIMMIFQELNSEGATVIMVTHEHDIARCTKRNIHLTDGKVDFDKAIEQIILGG